MFKVICPDASGEMDKYYRFRWEVLNKPLQLPLGSERDAYDDHSIHRMIRDRQGEPLAVGRLFLSDNKEALIRHVAVCPEQRKLGLGTLLMMALEEAAHDEGVERIVVNARGDAQAFFSSCGFEPAGNPTFDKVKIKVQQMVKELSPEHRFVRQPKLCTQLQQMFNQQIPLSEKMGVRLHQYTGNELTTKLPIAGNGNPHSTMFAGSIYSQAVLSGWGMIWLMLEEHGFAGDIVLAKGEIKHRKAIDQDALAKVKKSQMKGSLLPLIEGKKCKMTVTVQVCHNKEVAAEFKGFYVILPKLQAELDS
ncbi:GNAT family N-acetyltransferase [Agarivorans sp. B2Z047]|uniref:bifunctional GNAT family N-acetyltransferase/hotdog fold thioesterase n=1 Tax=Agarivorans sp. B2Z047 TaxID=2652721 RepID=UPI00128D27A5|nr:bifunctional GNAT family N-acetyltransferase/hotdog fold thioesterase [Agarivorans sp. B2Z047]MPW30263.1 GNAT family N-acetyltransferase [Agarivorans sp. B2Z047]UQN43106.1 bifunctional GNAT family N-acetyltransferase/hotdog fold thioesterase [Agarivorans sp. B2Z047]